LGDGLSTAGLRRVLRLGRGYLGDFVAFPIGRDHRLRIEPEVFGVVADEAHNVGLAREAGEVVVFNLGKEAERDVRVIGYALKRQALLESRFLEFLSYARHPVLLTSRYWKRKLL